MGVGARNITWSTYMKTALQLKEELTPFIEHKVYRCMSEIDELLADIYAHLTAEALKATGPSEDPTITGQMSLDLTHPFTPPKPLKTPWVIAMCGNYQRNTITGEVQKISHEHH